jgi:hypothetical protein
MKVHDRVSVDQWFLVAVGAALFVLSTAGLIHAVRASWASRLSCRAQLAKPPAEVSQVIEWCRAAYSLYPWNYYFSIYAAEAAYYQADNVRGEARVERLRQARVWCDRGLEQNPYKSQLRRLKTRFLWEESPARAIEYWKAHTEWQYWEPYNHATLAELYARYGDFTRAEEELKLGQGDVIYEQVCKIVIQEKKNWENLQSEKPFEWGE